MTRAGKFACAGCARTFLSASARRRHYEWNPDHERAAAARMGETGSPGVRWVEFDDRFETFLSLDGASRRIDVEYRPEDGTVAIDHPRERRIDVSEVRPSASGRVRWTFDGRYLTLTVPKSSRTNPA